MTRSPTTKAARRSHRGHVTLPVVETVRERWLRKHRRQFERFGFDAEASRRLVDAWAATGYLEIEDPTFAPIIGDRYFKSKAQITVGVDAGTWPENDDVFFLLQENQS